MPQGTQQQPIELPAVTAYGEQPERSLLQQLTAQLIQRANEPQDPFEVQSYTQPSAPGQESLLDFLVAMSHAPAQIKRNVERSGVLLQHLYPGSYRKEVEQQKEKEFENVANWMKTWFRSPITRERLEEGGRSPKVADWVASKAENLNFQLGNPGVSNRTGLVAGAYLPEENKSYVRPYYISSPNTLPYFRSKPFFEETAAHELMHQMTVNKMTDKEKDIIKEGVYGYKKVYDMASEQKGAWKPFVYKKEPRAVGGAEKDDASFEGYNYYTSPEEIYARIMSVRRSLGLLPGVAVAKKMLETIKNSPAMNDLLRYMPMEHVQKLMNTLAKKEDTPTEVFV